MTDRADLLAPYRELVLTEPPARAYAGSWLVHADHCFGRIVHDYAVGGRWYDVLDRSRSPAVAQLDDGQLTVAVHLAERMAAAGDPLVRTLDAQSPRPARQAPEAHARVTPSRRRPPAPSAGLRLAPAGVPTARAEAAFPAQHCGPAPWWVPGRSLVQVSHADQEISAGGRHPWSSGPG